jgi:hypothetical protein
MPIQSEGFEISPEITFRTYFAGGAIAVVPGSQTSRVHGKSTFQFARVARGFARVAAHGLLMRLGLLDSVSHTGVRKD